jgi:FtsP/CotA-like multicopper oxidase with cupredoxin domain
MIPAKARLHTELSNLTDVWVYRQSQALLARPPLEPQVPVGPTMEVQRGQRVHIEWVNALKDPDGALDPHPVVAVRDLPAYVQEVVITSEGGKERGDVHASENLPGSTGGKQDQSVAHLPPWTVVHLHGGRTLADYDGWPENAYYPGQVQITAYENNQPGALLWYHDQGMAITRLNVYTGLAGLYLIRDPLMVYKVE